MKKYPYVPKSNKKLEVGEIWPIKLPEKHYAYGVVLYVPNYAVSRKSFVAGLVNLIKKPNTSVEGLTNKPVEIYEYAEANIKTIVSFGEQIIGKIHVESYILDKIKKEDIRVTWGYNVINLKAEKLFKERQ